MSRNPDTLPAAPPAQQPETQLIEAEITLSYLNQKLNHIIGLLQKLGEKNA